jgi:hypothetical protein
VGDACPQGALKITKEVGSHEFLNNSQRYAVSSKHTEVFAYMAVSHVFFSPKFINSGPTETSYNEHGQNIRKTWSNIVKHVAVGN